MPKPSTLRIGHRYRQERLNGPYDALVIGSGIGGLAATALLAELGQRVAVLEQHYTAGGATHSYERAGYAPRDPFAGYPDNGLSLFMAKAL